jgi:hypothetical protein
VAAPFGDHPVGQHDDRVRVPDRIQPVRDQQRRPAGPVFPHGGVQLVLGVDVQPRARLVQHDQVGRLAQERPGQRHPSPLTAGEQHAGGRAPVRTGPRSDEDPGQRGVVAGRQGLQGLVHAGLPRRPTQPAGVVERGEGAVSGSL